MKHKTSFSLVFVSRIVIALVLLFIAIPVTSARTTESANFVESTTNTFSAAASVPGVRFVHTVTSANLIGDSTTLINHPLANNNPSAILFVTQNRNPGGVGSTYNNHAIGLRFFGSTTQRWAIFNQDGDNISVGTTFNVLIPATGDDVVVHIAAHDNITGNHTFINHPLTNDNPNAILLVTQNRSPSEYGGEWNNHPIGVYYSNITQQWAVFNQDRADMPKKAAFNVLILARGTEAFIHTAAYSNISGNETYINHPLTNNNPNAILFVTQNWNPGGEVIGVYNNQSIGVYYSSSAQKWSVFNQDTTTDMPPNASFNVLIPTTNRAVFVHTATDDNSAGSRTYIDHPLTNDNPNAILIVTQNLNPGGGEIGMYNDHPIGVYYFSGAHKWAIFNEDAAGMQPGTAFNVLIPSVDTSVFVHANTSGDSTYINHPLANNNPYAILLVTQNWNPSAVGGTYNNHVIGVRFFGGTSQRWAIINQDESDLPDDAAFNVLIPPTGTDVFVHTATNPAVNYSYINHSLTNNNPSATVLVTQNWNPLPGEDGVPNNQSIGVFYSVSMGKWAIFNQDTTANMPLDAAFNVLVVFNKIYLPIILR
ncbi:hypothetical protein ACFLUA_02860 [Chloroflexota bacterium]